MSQDSGWLLAPMAALRVFHEPEAGLAVPVRRWQVNAPARQLLHEHGLAEQVFQTLADEMRADGAGLWCAPGQHRSWSVWPTALSDGLLIWIQPCEALRARAEADTDAAHLAASAQADPNALLVQVSDIDERARRDFLSHMSHELRTPLNAVLGFAQLMRHEPGANLQPRQLHHLQRIEAAGRALLLMVEDTLRGGSQAMAANSAQLPIHPPTRAADGTAPRLRLLCVEDNPVSAALLRELLEMRPAIQYQICADGQTAMALASALMPDVFLLDMHLPDMSGTCLMRKLKLEATHAGSRYIALSADALPAQVEAARAAGFDDYWTKPFDVRDFMAALDDMVHALRQRQASSAPTAS